MLMSLVLVGASPQVYAKLTLDEFCKMRYDLAFASISDRMDPSASLPELLKNFNILVEEAKTKQTYNKKYFKNITYGDYMEWGKTVILEAYEESVLYSDGFNDRTIKRFSERAMVDCYRNNGEL